MIGMIRMTWPNLILLYCLNRKDKLVCTSVMDIEEEKERAKRDIMISIILIGILISLFFARNLGGFLILLCSGLFVGIFELIKDYKERRRK